MTIQDFRPVGEVTAMGRARVALGSAGVHDGDTFAVAVNSDGQLLLTPVTSIPTRELIVWQDRLLAESLARGIADARAGRIGPPLQLDDEPDE